MHTLIILKAQHLNNKSFALIVNKHTSSPLMTEIFKLSDFQNQIYFID